MFLKQIFPRETKLRGQICNNIFNCLFSKKPLVYRKFSRTSTIHPGIFRGQAKWADCVSPRINTIASRD